MALGLMRRAGVARTILRNHVRSNIALQFQARGRHDQADVRDADALVIGCGAAGSAAALRLANAGVKVTLLSNQEDPHECNSFWAQGGIIYKGDDASGDSPNLLAHDIHVAGAGVSEDAAVMKLSTEGATEVDELLLETTDIPFKRHPDGSLALTLEASHSAPRIIYKADHTGRVITQGLLKNVLKHPNIELLSNQTVVELAKQVDGSGAEKCVGAYAMNNETHEVQAISSPMTVLATGGAGDLYMNTSNPVGAVGSGLGLVASNFETPEMFKNMHYVQFHPTTLYIPGERRFLMTEALRGEGAILRNSHGEAFAKKYHPKGELAPRDVVARMILHEMAAEKAKGTSDGTHMYLDVSHLEPSFLKQRFPTIQKHLAERGIDFSKEAFPVVPAAHYHCGGIEVDLSGRTKVDGLYAAGEVSCTGLHGANRLASTSLLEALVWGSSIAKHYLAEEKELSSERNFPELNHSPISGEKVDKELISQLMSQVQQVMWQSFGPMRRKETMAEGIHELVSLEDEIEQLYNANALTPELVNLKMAVAASQRIAAEAFISEESVGTHYLQDEAEVTESIAADEHSESLDDEVFGKQQRHQVA